MSNNLLEIQDLLIEAEIEGAWKSIVNGLSLNLRKGEIVGLIGESGAGKSTLGLAALGYNKQGCRIVLGSIRGDGQELTTLTETELRKLRGVRWLLHTSPRPRDRQKSRRQSAGGKKNKARERKR